MQPPKPGDSTAAMGVVTGRVFRADARKPLAGAHLQVVGTPFNTFTDANGEYRLTFDAALVSNCRVQAVRVTAPGYQSRDLILSAGRRSSDDVWLGRSR
jgi:hypothetical protein